MEYELPKDFIKAKWLDKCEPLKTDIAKRNPNFKAITHRVKESLKKLKIYFNDTEKNDLQRKTN